MANDYLNSYVPLVASPAGRTASVTFAIPPFVDGSIRREPDLEHQFPSISCLCRADRFAPRLRTGDVVGYRTNRGRFGRPDGSHMRFVALLQVEHVLPDHDAGAAWYHERNLALPSNCMVRDNPAKPLEHSHRIFKASGCAGDARTHREWDLSYYARARRFPIFVVCRKLWADLDWSAPSMSVDDLVDAFGYRPSSQNPGRLPRDGFLKLLRHLGVEIDLPLE